MAGIRWARRMMAITALGMLGTALGCNLIPTQPGGGGGKASPTPSAPFTPTSSTLDFSGTAAPPFEDPTTVDERFSTRYSAGRWLPAGNEYRQQQEVRTATLMFQKYNGTALGLPGGQAPSKYRIDATVLAYKPVTSSASVIAGAPSGLLALVPYYLDTTHYIVMEAIQNRYEVWFVNGLTPGDEWAAENFRKFDLPMEGTASTAVGQPIQLGAEMDAKAGTMKVYINNELQAMLTDPSLIKDVQHSFALIANGNFVAYRDVKLTALSRD